MLRLLLHLLRVHNFAHVLTWHANRQPGLPGAALPRGGCVSASPRRRWRRAGNYFRARFARGQIDVGDGRLAGFKVHVEQFVAARYQPAESGRDWNLLHRIAGVAVVTREFAGRDDPYILTADDQLQGFFRRSLHAFPELLRVRHLWHMIGVLAVGLVDDHLHVFHLLGYGGFDLLLIHQVARPDFLLELYIVARQQVSVQKHNLVLAAERGLAGIGTLGEVN